jgi:FG-GAP-like repeat
VNAGKDNCGARTVAATDLDADGYVDIVVGCRDSDTVLWWHNDVTHNVTHPFQISYLLADQTDHVLCVVVAQITIDDTCPDVLAASSNDACMHWMKNNCNGTFATPVIISDDIPGAACIDTGDFDGDGTIDVLVAARSNVSTHALRWFSNDGYGRFKEHAIVFTRATRATSVAVADFDGDGDLDFVMCTYKGKFIKTDILQKF